MLFSFLIFITTANSQNTIGLPGIINYTKQTYKGGSQNWDIEQDASGIMYFANNEGLLSFDGNRWKLYPLPNKTNVRSLVIAPDKKIYVGGQGELGYFSPSQDGELHYTSLLPYIKEKDRSFDDVWDIKCLDGDVFFRSNSKIFQLAGKKIVVYPSKEWAFLGESNHQLIAQNNNYQLCFFKNGIWEPFGNKNEMPPNSWVTAVISLNKDSSLLVTQLSGLFILAGNAITAFNSPAISQISQQHISTACLAGNENVALGTSQQGIYVINKSGELIQSLSNEDGVQNNNILSVFLDNDHNIWLAMDNGIDMVAYNNAVRHIYIPGHSEAAGYSAALYKNKLYIGTSNGLYFAPLIGKEDISYTASPIKLVDNSRGQVWNLSQVNDKLLMGHNEGAFVINDENQRAERLSTTRGYWNFQPYGTTTPAPLMVAGTYNGLSFYNYANNTFSPSGLNINFESSRFVTIAADDKIWVAHPYKGLYCITVNYLKASSIKLYGAAQGIHSLNYVFKIKNQIIECIREQK